MSVNTPVKEDLIQEQILQAAKQLFTIHGLAKVTMDDVAKAIGKGRSSLYYYYKSKDEIFDAVINIEIDETLAAMEQAVKRATTTEEKIHAFFFTKLMVRREKGSFYNALEAGMDADAMSNFNKTKIVYHDQIVKREGILLAKILNEGIGKDELRVIKEDEMDSLIFVMLSTLHGIKRKMRMENNVRKIEPVMEQLTRMIMHGLHK